MNRASVAHRAAGRAAVAALALILALAVAACGTADPSGGTPRPTRASASSDAASSGDLPPTFGPPPSPSFDEDTPAILDPTVLAYLPAEIDRIPVVEALDEAAIALSNPAVADFASAVDAAVAVDAGNGNLVSAYVVRVKPDKFNAEIFRQWRDSFDESACTAAGGVVGRAEAEIGGRNAYVTSCVAGLRTYHVYIEAEDILISASSIGEGRFGEKLLTGVKVIP